MEEGCLGLLAMASVVAELESYVLVRPIRETLPMAIAARVSKKQTNLVPKVPAAEGSIARNIGVYPLKCLAHVAGLIAEMRFIQFSPEDNESSWRIPPFAHSLMFSRVKGHDQVKTVLAMSLAAASISCRRSYSETSRSLGVRYCTIRM
jgi:predicted ATPase with chaperone activity